MEDEVYDSVNQLYEYSRDYLQNPAISLDREDTVYSGYDRWIFNRLLAENHGQTVIKSVWEKLRYTTKHSNNTDGYGNIFMLPVIDDAMNDIGSGLPAEFISFAKRLYTKNWTSHTNELQLLYSAPLSIEDTYTSYPVNSSTSPSSSTSLSHYSIKYFKFTPASAVADLTITVNSADGISTALFKKAASVTTEIPPNIGGNATQWTYTVEGFGSLSQR